MGGGGDVHHHGADGDFRTKVWSMTGGPYCRPKHWKRNTAIAMFGIFLVCIPIAMKSAELEGYKCQFHTTTVLLMIKRLSNRFSGRQRMTYLPDQKPRWLQRMTSSPDQSLGAYSCCISASMRAYRNVFHLSFLE